MKPEPTKQQVPDVVPINGGTWLICGGRDFTGQAMFDAAMHDLCARFGMPSKVVHGNARGADRMADEWGVRSAIPVFRYPADWNAHGRAAGPLRNQKMLDEAKPSLVVAFPGGRGTADMVRRARDAGVSVVEIGAKEAV